MSERYSGFVRLKNMLVLFLHVNLILLQDRNAISFRVSGSACLSAYLAGIVSVRADDRRRLVTTMSLSLTR